MTNAHADAAAAGAGDDPDGGELLDEGGVREVDEPPELESDDDDADDADDEPDVSADELFARLSVR